MGSRNIFKRVRMTGYEIYVLILCFIVFTLLTAMFTYLIASMTKMERELIRCGRRDEAIRKEVEKELKKNKKLSQATYWFTRFVSLILCVALIAVFVFAIYVRTTEDKAANGIPSIKVVKSESMSEKYIGNKYLFENDLNDQFQMFDIILCSHMPEEEDLELYDVVVYKYEDIYVIHRIVGIEEPNKLHPNERHYVLQGDAVETPDRLVVKYSQMQGIYEGVRVPYVGSFLMFLQSPAGWLCVLLVIFAMVITPIVEKRIEKEKNNRKLVIFAKDKAPITPSEIVKNEEKRAWHIKLSLRDIMVYTQRENGRYCEVSTSAINKNYSDGERVDLDSLKKKKLVQPNCRKYKIIATSELEKRLIVDKPSTTKRAAEAILRAGGTLEKRGDRDD